MRVCSSQYAISEATPRLLGLGQVDIIKPIADIAYPTTETHVTPDQGVAFLSAYERLCTQTSPGTASSLRNTNIDTLKGVVSEMTSPSNAAWQVTRSLLIATFVFLSIVIATDIVTALYGPPREYPDDYGQFLSMFLGLREPFVYGGQGACAYLLRRAHANFRAEYLTRILVGVVSGGAVTLFVVYVVDADGVVPRLSQAAIGFLAGCSTERLFRTVDRILDALFARANPAPKV